MPRLRGNLGDISMKTLGQFMGGVTAWWSSWRQSVANDQTARRKMKSMEDRVEDLELIKKFCLHDPISGSYISHKLYRDPNTDIRLMVTKEYKL